MNRSAEALQEPVVSVIIPAHNAAAYLAEAVQSALNQTLREVEVIIVDDASSDETVPCALGLASQDERVRLVSFSRNGGPSAARNQGIALARGSWTAVLDADDRYHPDRLRLLLDHAEDTGVDMIADDLAVIGEGPLAQDARQLGGQVSQSEEISLQDYLERTSAWGRARDPGFLKPMFRTSLLRGLPYGYDERLRVAEDDDLVVRLLLAGARYRLVPEQFYFYRQHAGSVSRQLSLAQLEAMIAAGERQVAEIATSAPHCLAAARRRVSTRRRALEFERAVAGIKNREVMPVLASLLRNPGMAAMFAEPLRKRLAGLGQRS